MYLLKSIFITGKIHEDNIKPLWALGTKDVGYSTRPVGTSNVNRIKERKNILP